MAGGFPVGLRWGPNGEASGVGASSQGIGGVSDTSAAHSKGAWTQLIASTGVDAAWVSFSYRPQTVGRVHLIDLGVGAAGSEIPILSNIPHFYNSTLAQTFGGVTVPLHVPKGSRIAARNQCDASAGSQVFYLARILPDAMGSVGSQSIADTYNADTTTSRTLVAVDPGGTANTKGSYAELAAATTQDYSGFFLGFTAGSATNSSSSNQQFILDLAVGASGSEKIIVPNIIMNGYSNTSLTAFRPANTPYFPIPIPAGCRIAARAQSSATDANGRLIGVTFHGIP